MNHLKKASAVGAMTLAGFLATASSTYAQDITLRSSDGTVNMNGELVSFEDNSYVIRTALGQLRVSASRVSCTGAACPDLAVGDIDVAASGSDAVGLGLMPLLLEGYAASLDAAATINNTTQIGQFAAGLVADQGFGDDIATIQVTSTGTSDGLADLLSRRSEIAMAARRIQPVEAEALSADGAGDMFDPAQEHIVAVDSLIVITHPDNPIQTMNVRQLLGIYSGAISNWSQVGGPDLPVQVVIRNVGSNRRDVFEARIFGSDATALTSDAQVVANSNEVAQAVNANPGAIGVVGYAFQRGAQSVNIVNQCGITMVPDTFSAKTEEYALQRRLFLYTRGDTLSPEGRDFVEYATSAEADNVIRKAGFIGFSVDRREQSLEDVRAQALLNPNADPNEVPFMRQMLARMIDYDRLSTTFRFRTGSSLLDERGRIDKLRLVEYLETQPAGTEVLLVGFTDEVGPFSNNLALSERRSAQVTAELQEFAGTRLNGISFASVGYGEIAPAGCNASDDGRRINRRVEVWIKSPA